VTYTYHYTHHIPDPVTGLPTPDRVNVGIDDEGIYLAAYEGEDLTRSLEVDFTDFWSSPPKDDTHLRADALALAGALEADDIRNALDCATELVRSILGDTYDEKEAKEAYEAGKLNASTNPGATADPAEFARQIGREHLYYLGDLTTAKSSRGPVFGCANDCSALFLPEYDDGMVYPDVFIRPQGDTCPECLKVPYEIPLETTA
jgi:hypothetical protein